MRARTRVMARAKSEGENKSNDENTSEGGSKE